LLQFHDTRGNCYFFRRQTPSTVLLLVLVESVLRHTRHLPKAINTNRPTSQNQNTLMRYGCQGNCKRYCNNRWDAVWLEEIPSFRTTKGRSRQIQKVFFVTKSTFGLLRVEKKKSTMLFSRASTSSLVKNFARRAKSSGAGAEETAAAGGGLAAAVATTFGTYMLADFLSNFIQHPTQKVSTDSAPATIQVGIIF
jgi:hypothetical protein